jgi:hypothetical protein
MQPAARAQALVERSAAINWRSPVHDPLRAIAAYQLWLGNLALRRTVRWVSDPDEVASWQIQTPGTLNMWSTMASASFWGRSVAGPLLSTPSTPAAVDPLAMAALELAADWAMTATLHINFAEGTSEGWLKAWSEAGASAPALAQAQIVLSGGNPYAPPPTIARELANAALTSGDQDIEAMLAMAEPMIAACEAGAFAHVLHEDEIVVLASPAIWADGRRLHRADGPALAWPRTKLYAWRGLPVPDQVILEPHLITPDVVRAAPQVIQQMLVDRYIAVHGHERCMRDMGGIMEHEDATGRLWCINPGRPMPPPDPADIKMVEVTNGTPEPDGSHKTYWLRVPREIRTSRQAVAWTYGMTAEDYEGLVVRT